MLKIFKYFFKKIAKNFLYGIVIVAGRNFLGRIRIQHKGGGQKVKYLKIDRYRNLNQFGVVVKIIKNYFYTGFVGFILYDNGLCSFIILAEGLLKGSKIFSGKQKMLEYAYKLGSSQKLLHINLFDTINSVELFPFSGALLARSAGTGAKIISKDNIKSVLKLTSGWIVRISNHSLGTFGIVSNQGYIYRAKGKAGNIRRAGIRPTVRGVIKNPCDHPHGGGEGKGSPPVAQVSPWGWLCKGTPSKNRKVDKLKRKLLKKI